MKVLVMPSLLAADVGHLEDGARRAQESGADALHIDIMDGHLVPNLSMGPAVVQMAKRCLSIPLSVHLMLTNPDQFVEPFVRAGADSLFIHIEAECDVPATLQRIRDCGIRAGITLNPETPATMVESVLNSVDEVLCMSVHPGYGGQTFMPEVLPKIREIRNRCVQLGRYPDIVVDGGIDLENAAQVAGQGANALVAGTSLYRAADMAAAVAEMRRRAEGALHL